MSQPIKPTSGTYRVTSDGAETAGKQIDLEVEGDSLKCAIGHFIWAPPPMSAFVDGDNAIEFREDPDRVNIILNNRGHGGTYQRLPA